MTITKIKDPGSAITHFIALVACMLMTTPLLVKVAMVGADGLEVFSYGVFMTSAVLLYAASTAYHTFDISATVNAVLKKLDHMMICVLIAGTYTPICLTALAGPKGYKLLAIVWSFAVLGMVFKLFWTNCPKWVSSVIYIVMGWSCVYAMPQIIETLPLGGFLWLLAGGIFYTVGGVIYALKLKAFDDRFNNFGSHEIFHLFVMGGTACHYVFMFCYLVKF